MASNEQDDAIARIDDVAGHAQRLAESVRAYRPNHSVEYAGYAKRLREVAREALRAARSLDLTAEFARKRGR